VLPNGQWVGSTSLHVNDLHLDPHRFQYKISGIDEKTGVTKELSESSKFNPDLAGQVLVWRDPADGKTYVVNGHHRVELARRSGGWENEETGEGWHGDIQARYINANSASEARAKGALANIAEGRGTATDAAKFMRDTGRSIEDLQKEGISIRGKLASDALQLKDLSPRAFQDLAQERLPESRAIAVAKHLKDHDKQDWLFNRLANREREGKPTSDSLAATMAKGLAISQPAQATGGGLFGDDFQEQTFDQRNELIDALARELSSEKNIFKSVSSSRRVGKITEEGKNTLDVEGNKQRAQEAAELQYLFDREANSKGPVSDLINQAAAELLHKPKRKAEILKGLKRDVFPLMQRGKDQDDSTPPRDSYSATAADARRDRGAEKVGPDSRSMAGSDSGRGPAAARGSDWDSGRIRERLTAPRLRPHFLPKATLQDRIEKVIVLGGDQAFGIGETVAGGQVYNVRQTGPVKVDAENVRVGKTAGNAAKKNQPAPRLDGQGVRHQDRIVCENRRHIVEQLVGSQDCMPIVSDHIELPIDEVHASIQRLISTGRIHVDVRRAEVFGLRTASLEVIRPEVAVEDAVAAA
jgi:hypothetical protein